MKLSEEEQATFDTLNSFARTFGVIEMPDEDWDEWLYLKDKQRQQTRWEYVNVFTGVMYQLYRVPIEYLWYKGKFILTITYAVRLDIEDQDRIVSDDRATFVFGRYVEV